jgi:hypothetical protein
VRTNTPRATIDIGRLADAGNAAIGVGWGGTIVLGIWLAFSVGGYDVWDGWIIAALALWALSLPLGQRTSATYEEGVKKARELQAKGQTGPSSDLLALNRAPKGAVAHFLTSVIVLLVLTDMIWKPGA